MVTDDFHCRLHIKPIWWSTPPSIIVKLDNAERWSGYLEHNLDLNLTGTLSKGGHELSIYFYGKTNDDTQGDHDKAVVIDQIAFFGIEDARFKKNATYRPYYPEPWHSQQIEQGLNLAPVLHGVDYLGWNGTWRLEFNSPIFTWMFQQLDMGWIYD